MVAYTNVRQFGARDAFQTCERATRDEGQGRGFMGDVVVLAERRRMRDENGNGGATAAVADGPARSATFLFDLASPLTYLAAERVERLLGTVRWQPVAAEALHRGNPWVDPAARAAAERRAAALHLPLVWPDRFPDPGRAALRAAAYAADHGRGAAFTLAACRLAYCGGFDLEDPEVLAEAAAAAGLGLEECLAAAGDIARDGPLEAAGRRLLAAGADGLPAVRVGRTLICGEERLSEASAWLRRHGSGARRVTGLQLS
jgi:2-hydroxychromene-2-carboxylate isomerase